MRHLGSIVVDEIIVPVVDVTLDRGAFVITAHVMGPVPAVDTTHYVVMDRQGSVVYRSSGQLRVYWPALTLAQSVQITVDMNVVGKVARRV